jgi:hypothetical protein
MKLTTSLIVFTAIVISVNNFALYYAIKNNSIHSRIHSVGLMIFLFSLIEIIAIGIWAYIHLK